MKLGKGKNTKPHQLRKTGAKAAAKLRRREEAQARNAAWNKLTPTEQAIEISHRRGNSERQLARLRKLLSE